MVHLPRCWNMCNQRTGQDPAIMEPNAMGKTELGCCKGCLAPFLYLLTQGEASGVSRAVPNSHQITKKAKSSSLPASSFVTHLGGRLGITLAIIGSMMVFYQQHHLLRLQVGQAQCYDPQCPEIQTKRPAWSRTAGLNLWVLPNSSPRYWQIDFLCAFSAKNFSVSLSIFAPKSHILSFTYMIRFDRCTSLRQHFPKCKLGIQWYGT